MSIQKILIATQYTNAQNSPIRGATTASLLGGTPLHCAPKSGHDGAVKLLLRKGADVTALTNIRVTALHLAALNGHDKVVRLLMEQRTASETAANTRILQTRETPLH